MEPFLCPPVSEDLRGGAGDLDDVAAEGREGKKWNEMRDERGSEVRGKRGGGEGGRRRGGRKGREGG